MPRNVTVAMNEIRLTCAKCKQEKVLSDFYPDRTRKDAPHGLMSWCKVCSLKATQDRYRKTLPAMMLLGARKRAQKLGVEFSLTLADIKIPEFCPVLGIPLKASRGRMDKNSPTLDRIDNSRGYVADNIQVISWRANALKKDATPQELYRLYIYSKGLIMTPQEEKEVLKTAINEWLDTQWAAFGKWTAMGLLAALLAALVTFVLWVKGLPLGH